MQSRKLSRVVDGAAKGIVHGCIWPRISRVPLKLKANGHVESVRKASQIGLFLHLDPSAFRTGGQECMRTAADVPHGRSLGVRSVPL